MIRPIEILRDCRHPLRPCSYRHELRCGMYLPCIRRKWRCGKILHSVMRLFRQAFPVRPWQSYFTRTGHGSRRCSCGCIAQLSFVCVLSILGRLRVLRLIGYIGDMATGGRYYSEFLLTVICAHSAKYQEGNAAEFLLTRARRLLGTAIQQPSSIPTVQALLQLSARDLAHGSISQAWVYSGIAFRMASDLGLQHSSKDVRGLNPVDLEIRRRLFWGCYFLG